MKNGIFNEQIDSLEEELQELLNEAEKMIGHKPEGINQTIKDLKSLKTKKSKALAEDIIDIQDEIIATEEFSEEVVIKDDPFITLYDEDSEL